MDRLMRRSKGVLHCRRRGSQALKSINNRDTVLVLEQLTDS